MGRLARALSSLSKKSIHLKKSSADANCSMNSAAERIVLQYCGQMLCGVLRTWPLGLSSFTIWSRTICQLSPYSANTAFGLKPYKTEASLSTPSIDPPMTSDFMFAFWACSSILQYSCSFDVGLELRDNGFRYFSMSACVTPGI